MIDVQFALEDLDAFVLGRLEQEVALVIYRDRRQDVVLRVVPIRVVLVLVLLEECCCFADSILDRIAGLTEFVPETII